MKGKMLRVIIAIRFQKPVFRSLQASKFSKSGCDHHYEIRRKYLSNFINSNNNQRTLFKVSTVFKDGALTGVPVQKSRQRLHEHGFLCNSVYTTQIETYRKRVDLKRLPKVERFLKRCSFICRVSSETASI